MSLNPMSSNLPQRNPLAMLTEFNKFKKQMQGRDARSIVEAKLKSGEMTPQQFEQLKSMAQTLQDFLR